nr:hypothetical protein [Chryseobacterium sp. NKUCC03_KSP]
MISKRGTLFNATVQFNADKRYVEFLFNRNNNINHKSLQNHLKSKTFQTPLNTGISINFRGKPLHQWQIEKLKKGEPAYINDLTDKNGNKYQGYIIFDKNIGKFEFSFKNPVKEQVKINKTVNKSKGLKM